MFAFVFANAARLLDSTQKSRDLPQGLIFASLQSALQSCELRFVAHDRPRATADSLDRIAEDERAGLAGGCQLQHACPFTTDHHADVIFELSEIALLTELFLIEAGWTREKRFARGRRRAAVRSRAFHWQCLRDDGG